PPTATPTSSLSALSLHDALPIYNGTFRGFNPAMVTGSESLRLFWQDDAFAKATKAKGDMVAARLREIAAEHPETGAHVRGRGLGLGLAFEQTEVAKKLTAECFDRGLLLETSGPEDEVAKLLPPLTATEEELSSGLDIMADAARAAVKVPQLA